MNRIRFGKVPQDHTPSRTTAVARQSNQWADLCDDRGRDWKTLRCGKLRRVDDRMGVQTDFRHWSSLRTPWSDIRAAWLGSIYGCMPYSSNLLYRVEREMLSARAVARMFPSWAARTRRICAASASARVVAPLTSECEGEVAAES